MAEGITKFLSPEGVVVFPMMLFIAVLLDIIGIVLICFALDDFFITDIIGFVTIGSWSFFRSFSRAQPRETEVEMPQMGRVRKIARRMKEVKRKIKRAKRVARMTKAAKSAKWAKRLKWLRPLFIICEFIIYLGALPLWTVFVYLEWKYS